jgi:hypothetical protein
VKPPTRALGYWHDSDAARRKVRNDWDETTSEPFVMRLCSKKQELIVT